MKNIKKYLGRNDLKTLAHHFGVSDNTVQRALRGYPSELSKHIRAYALNMAIARYQEFQKEVEEFKKQIAEENAQ
jgi:DNA-binding LacI/PurR family transcriptional regulator